ncbi:MAG: ABC transporter permease subunit [Gammaproteobacteria bacterium]|nr:ABC transporter permease subunit [Gammaproteobacteria bacterium]MXW19835.1 ABC transporter permease subunit [Gammaproteobacteria bacterium]
MSAVFEIARESLVSLLQRRGLRGFMLFCTILTMVLGLAAAAARIYVEDALDAVAQYESQQDESQQTEEAGEVDVYEQAGYNRSLARFGANVIVWYVGVSVFLGILATLYLGATGVRRDMGSGTARQAVSGSVTRGEYLLGKYLAAMTVITGFWLILGTELALFMSLLQEEGTPAHWHFEIVYLLSLGLLSGSMAFMLSLYMPPFLAGLLALFADGELFRESLGESNPFYYLHFVLPDSGLFDVSQLSNIAAYTDGVGVFFRILYTLNFAAILFLVALLRFHFADLKRYEQDEEWLAGLKQETDPR